MHRAGRRIGFLVKPTVRFSLGADPFSSPPVREVLLVSAAAAKHSLYCPSTAMIRRNKRPSLYLQEHFNVFYDCI